MFTEKNGAYLKGNNYLLKYSLKNQSGKKIPIYLSTTWKPIGSWTKIPQLGIDNVGPIRKWPDHIYSKGGGSWKENYRNRTPN